MSYQSTVAPGWSCTVAGRQLGCTYAGALAVGAQTSLTVSVMVLADAYPAVTTTATVTGTGSMAPATGTDTSQVTPSVSLGLAKSLLSYTDGTASYRLTVSNQGANATVAPVIVTDPLPAGLSYTAASGSGWSCNPAATVLRCVRPAGVAPGAAPPITLTTLVSATPGTVIRNIASVSGGGGLRSSASVASNAAVLSVRITGSGSQPPSSQPPSSQPPGSSSQPPNSQPSNSQPSNSQPPLDTATGSGAGTLPQTGRELGRPVAAAVLLLLWGVLLRWYGRRRNSSI